MKKNRGFALVETLIVSTVIATILIYIFVQFNNVQNKYNESMRYNDVGDLYKLDSIKDYIKSLDNIAINNIITVIDSNGMILIERNENDYSNISYLDNQSSLLSNLGVKTLVLTKADVRLVDTSSLSENLKDMIKRINNRSDNYRMIVEFDNSSAATITMSLEVEDS